MTVRSTFWITVDKVKTCKYCKAEIAWFQSKRTGRWYPCNVYTVSGTNEKFTAKNHFHTCRRTLTAQEEVDLDFRFKEAHAEIERRQEQAVYEAKERTEKEAAEKIYAEKLIKELANLRWDERERIDHKMSAWYDHTFYKVPVDRKPDTYLLRNALNGHWQVGAHAAACGKFGGWNSVGQIADNNDGSVTIEVLYHIGD